ncbi:stress-induced protein [Streptococcus ruminantium]|uniref:stress-induced protein n=1 Tax=Streptococcus ruminantium TaxID=1917441 RepID=UPI0012DF54D1|nr:stress-induced protein [Streptococcus ruminantium]
MANESNLIPANKRSQSEARENGKKGGIASGKARRKKADLRRAFETILQADVASDGVRRHLEGLGFEATNEMALAMVMMQKAMKGDVRAFEQISKLTSIDTKDALDRKEQKERIKSLQLQNEVKRKAANDDDSTEQIIVVDRWSDD